VATIGWCEAFEDEPIVGEPRLKTCGAALGLLPSLSKVGHCTGACGERLAWLVWPKIPRARTSLPGESRAALPNPRARRSLGAIEDITRTLLEKGARGDRHWEVAKGPRPLVGLHEHRR
jgi:hypothetical protein